MIRHTRTESSVPVAPGWEVVALESTTSSATIVADRVIASATKRPSAVRVRGPDGERVIALGPDGGPASGAAVGLPQT